jgi:SAM-dependent methyltransferase
MTRDQVRRLARESIERGDAVGWFDELYRRVGENWSRIPWADLAPNPYLVEWLEQDSAIGAGKPCLVVGCGLGDDAELLAERGYDVVAYDISATAIDGCRARFPASEVEYVVADALAPLAPWLGHFALVFESYTLQVLPPDARARALRAIASTVGPEGRLLVLCRAREKQEPEGELPWPLMREELDAFHDHGLTEVAVESVLDRETPAVRRFLALYERRVGRAVG